MQQIENYLKYCNDSNINLNYFYMKKRFPKISIISAVYNRGKFLLRFLKSIQNQKFNDIEIILIDDYSSDNTLNLIQKYKSIDKRIELIKNKKNYGTFKSRNLGICKSTGKYLILPDPDDILSKNSLNMFYNYAIKYNYEMIRFNLYEGNYKIFGSSFVKISPNGPIFQPEIQTFEFYGAGYLRQIDFNLSNKFIKREALIKAMNLLSKKYINIYMTTLEDGTLNYIKYNYSFHCLFYYFYIF